MIKAIRLWWLCRKYNICRRHFDRKQIRRFGNWICLSCEECEAFEVECKIRAIQRELKGMKN